MVLVLEAEGELQMTERDYAALGDAMALLARRRRVKTGPYAVYSYMVRRHEELGLDPDKEVPSGSSGVEALLRGRRTHR